MQIFFIRHGETDWNNMNLIQGTTDNPLNQKGIEQAQTLHTFFIDKKIDIIVSSPLKRSLQTACISLNCLENEVDKDTAFLERNFGTLEGQDVAVYPQADLTKVTGYENNEDLINRVVTGLNTLIVNNPDKNIAIFTHSHVLKAILVHTKQEKNFRFTVKNCAIVELHTTTNSDLEFINIH